MIHTIFNEEFLMEVKTPLETRDALLNKLNKQLFLIVSGLGKSNIN